MLTRTTPAKNKNINPNPIHAAGPLRMFGVGGIAAEAAMVSRTRVLHTNVVNSVCNRRICKGYQLGRGSEASTCMGT